MKKIITTVLTVLVMVFIFPVTASAEETLKAPTVQYKLINHDKTALRWTEVEGAESYFIYMRDDNTGKYIKKFEVKSNSVTLKNLSPDTEYSYSVVAVKGEKKIKYLNKVTFTTPSEWYYSFEYFNPFGNSEPIGRYYFDDGDSGQCYRQHYDGTGKEIYNMDNIYKALVEYYDENYSPPGYELSVQCQNKGYVYFNVLIYDDGDYYSNDFGFRDTWRMDNSGEKAEYCCPGADHYELFFDKNNNVFFYTADFWENPDIEDDYIYVCNIWCNDEWCYKGDLIRGMAVNDNEIFISEAKNGQRIHIYNKIIKINSNHDIQVFMTSDDNVSLTPFFCDENYLYYIETIYSDSKKKDTLKRVMLNDKNRTETLYTFETKPESFPTPPYDFELCNGYIYFSYDKEFCRIKSDGTEFEEQDKPFEWRY